MKMKNLLLTIAATLGLTALTMAQNVPNYVPTNGLVGWWPFNGNANDESGNGNNGTVNGATLTMNRFGAANSAFHFDGASSFIDIPNLNSISYKPITYNLWINLSSYNTLNYPLGGGMLLVGRDWSGYYDIGCLMIWDYPQVGINNELSYYIGQSNANSSFTPQLNQWTNITMTISSQDTIKFYINGVLSSTQYYPTNSNVNGPFRIGAGAEPMPTAGRYFYNGVLDDVGVWNRTLTQQEITDLYNGCQLSINLQPSSQTININSNAQFAVGSSEPSATFQWQTDLGVGFQNLNNVGQYSGTTNDTLNVANVAISNNNQPFRCIISSGSCTDTSSVALLTVNNNVGTNDFTQGSLFSVYPNPAQSILEINNANINKAQQYTILNSEGRAVLSGTITQPKTIVSLESIPNGVYIIDFANGNRVKIIKN